MYLLIAAENNSHFSVAKGEEKIEKIKTVKKVYRQSELLLKTIEQVLRSGSRHKAQRKVEDSRLKIQEIKGIIVVSGPGQFSALRTGVATANALGFAYKIPVVGVQLEEAWLGLEEKEKIAKVWATGLKKMRRKIGLAKIIVPIYGSEPNINFKK